MIKLCMRMKRVMKNRDSISFSYYDLIVAAFVAVLLISNIAAIKLIKIGPIITDGGAVLFPLAYIFGDILTEVYGYSYTRRAIWAGFSMMIIAVVAFTIVQFMPPAPEWFKQEAYVAILGFLPRIVLASLVAYLVGEFLNSFVLAKLKVKHGGEQLWVRLIGSTVVGEFFDTVVFGLIAFSGKLKPLSMVNFVLVGWIFKTMVEVVMLPITYKLIHFLKVHEGVDAYDKKTDFTPFSLSVDK